MSASRIASKLYQGSIPPSGTALRDSRIRVLVLCASELQPDEHLYPGVEVLRCPFVDVNDTMGLSTLRMIEQTAARVARRVAAQKRTLVTCAAGLNRSGLVVALALTELYGISGHEAVAWVRRERQGALFNPTFVRIVEAVPAKLSVAAAAQ